MERHRVRERFGRAMRMSQPRDIQRVFQDSVKISNAYVTIRARRRAIKTPRLALAIAKKHVSSAVKRNRIKRVVRESFRRNVALLAGLDVVVISLPALAGTDNESLRQALDAEWPNLLEKVRLSTEKSQAT